MAEAMKGLFDLPGDTPAQWSLAAYKTTLTQLTTVMRVFNMTPEVNAAWDKLDATLDDIGDPKDADEVDDQLSRLYALHKQAWTVTSEAAAKRFPHE